MVVRARGDAAALELSLDRSLQRDNRGCRACAEEGYPLESLPVVLPYTGQRAYLSDRRRGIQEGQERLPWRGRAGKTLRRWFDLDEDDLLLHVLLRVRDALLSRAGAVRPRRPDAGAAGSRISARSGATGSSACCDPSSSSPSAASRRAGCSASRASRRRSARGTNATVLLRSRCRTRPARASWLNDHANRARVRTRSARSRRS